ncbi:universal stress protein [Streptomyces sp. NPDC002952]|uniref:universal stress protein n=1 Tax=Streptomyces sp. NPDC002952 TaxID=3364673 RepID=UPI00369317B3
MPRTVTVGLDGSPESRAAADWAAREAALRGLPVKLVHVWEPVPEPFAQAPLLGVETQQHWTERIPREAAEALRERHPGVDIVTEQISGRPAEALSAAAQDAALLVLGSRGLSGVGGFMVGSVGQAVVARTLIPVVLVRATEPPAGDLTGTPASTSPDRPVVLGLAVDSPDGTLVEFALQAAELRRTSLRVVHGWNPPPYYAYGLAADLELHQELSRQQASALADVLLPWQQKFPAVEVTAESHYGSAANLLTDASRDASLVVVGRRVRRNPIGAHIGSVAHAVMHHATAPVAVVAHH